MRNRMIGRSAIAAGTAAVLGLGGFAVATSATAATSASANQSGTTIKHVLLISVDGLHQQDLAWYVHAYPGLRAGEVV